MPKIIPTRMAVEIEGDFVVFSIGMRVNKPWKLHKWLPVFLAMPRMLKELQQRPESGFLGSISGGLLIVQYWRSFDDLEAYARSHDHLHWPAWAAFNRRMANSRGDVGIWHETYLVRAGEYEGIYSGMPPSGLGRAGNLVPASGRKESARGRVERDIRISRSSRPRLEISPSGIARAHAPVRLARRAAQSRATPRAQLPGYDRARTISPAKSCSQK